MIKPSQFAQALMRRILARETSDTSATAAAPRPSSLRPILRVHDRLWQEVIDHLHDDRLGEQAGILLIAAHYGPDTLLTEPQTVLTVRAFLPVTEDYVTDRSMGLDYDGRFHLAAARTAAQHDAGMILVHSHAHQRPPVPSHRDRNRGHAFLTFATRRLPDHTHGLLVLGAGSATANVVLRSVDLNVAEIVVVGQRRSRYPVAPWAYPRLPETNNRLAEEDSPDRQALVFGAAGTTALSQCRIAVVGVSGGGSHVVQQLIHAGVGTLLAVDADHVEKTNVRRLVMSTDHDIDRTHKVDLPVRLATALHGGATQVIPVPQSFPSADTIAALRTADVIVGCVDGWDVRDDLNTFALEHRIPYVDIGAIIVPGDETPRASGQVAVVLPGGPCLRCMGLVTDRRVEASRRQRQGYLDGEPEPQVISINGTLASEAVTAVLLLVASGTAHLVPRRNYRYPPGKLVPADTAQDPACPACRRSGLA